MKHWILYYSSEELLLHDAAFRKITALFCMLIRKLTAIYGSYSPGYAVGRLDTHYPCTTKAFQVVKTLNSAESP